MVRRFVLLGLQQVISTYDSWEKHSSDIVHSSWELRDIVQEAKTEVIVRRHLFFTLQRQAVSSERDKLLSLDQQLFTVVACEVPGAVDFVLQIDSLKLIVILLIDFTHLLSAEVKPMSFIGAH